MASTTETGHAKNTANFKKLIDFAISFGEDYSPSRENLKIPQLTELQANAAGKLTKVIKKNTEFNNKVNSRGILFDKLQTLYTRIINALQATDATAQQISDAKGFNRKIQGKRASQPSVPIDPEADAPRTISASQTSFIQRLQHFEGLIAVLQSEASYSPNEKDLKIVTLNEKHQEMEAANDSVGVAHTAVSNSRIARNNVLYQPETGLVKTALAVKNYIKSVYTANSPQYKQISKIPFRTIKG